MCAYLVYVRACMRAYVRVAQRSQWPGQVCGWCPFSQVSPLETETKDRWIYLPGKERVFILSRDSLRPSLPRPSNFSSLFSRTGLRGPAILLQLLDQRRDLVTLRSLRHCGLMKRRTESNISQVTGRPLLLASTSVCAEYSHELTFVRAGRA